jgi:LacI family transcriptional regulator
VRQKVTIRDVAAAAGVSHQTVSRVINDRPDVADETRERVWQVIKELNYQPSAIARSLIRQRSLTVGIVTAGLKFAGPSRTLNGITEQAEELGYTLLLKELPDFGAGDVKPLLNSLLARRVDGILWAVPEVGQNRIWVEAQLEELPVPTIFTTMQARPDAAIVAVDNYAGGRMATEHLLQQGYQRIGHVSGPLDWWEARQRKAGWQDALRDAGIPPAETHAEEGDWASASGERAICRLLERHPDLDAVFVGNDQMALGVLQTACRQGIRVPHDLAVVGFDGLPEAAHYWPPLTTIYQDLRKLGCTAVQQLVRAIETSRQEPTPDDPDSRPASILLTPDLIVRESSLATGARDCVGQAAPASQEKQFQNMETN